MIKHLSSFLFSGMALSVLCGTASAQTAHMDACAAGGAGVSFDCGCVSEKFESASTGMSPGQKTILSDFIAMGIGAKNIPEPDPMELMQVADQLSIVGDIAVECMSDELTQELAEAEAEAERQLAEQDRVIAAEKARTDAIPTAPPPPEVTDPDNHPALAGAAGYEAATEFRDYVIADCRSFGNTPGYCGCYADAAEDLMTPEQVRAHVVSSQVNREADQGLVSIEDMDKVKAARLGVSEKQVRDYAAQWNGMVQSQAYTDIHWACEAYQ